MNKIKLGDILELQPKSKVKAGDGISNGKYPFYTCSNELTKSLNNADYEGDALIFGTGGMASIHYEKGKFSTSTDCLVYKTNKNINLSLINKYLKTNIHLLENGFKGAGLRHISRDYISNISIPLPERNIQDKIVKELDLIEKTITIHNDVLKKYDTLIKSRFIEMFGDPIDNPQHWKTEKLNNICTEIVDCPHSTPHYTSENTGYMCIRTNVIRDFGLDWDNIEYISEDEYYKRITRRKPCYGDIVYLREGGILGIAAIINKEENIALGQRTMLLSPNYNKCNSQYICNTMNMKSFYHKALEKMGGSASPHINVADIKNFQIPVPPLSLQINFAQFVQQIDKSKFAVQKSLEKAETLYKSLMQEYFG